MHHARNTSSKPEQPWRASTRRRRALASLLLPIVILSLGAICLRATSSSNAKTIHPPPVDARHHAKSETYVISDTLSILPLDVPVWRPRWLALDEAGNLYVADIAQRLVRVFNPAGQVIDTWREPGPPDTVPCMYFPMQVFYDQAMRLPANRKPRVVVLWITDYLGDVQPGTGKCESIIERRSPIDVPERDRTLQKILHSSWDPAGIDPASGEVYFGGIGCGANSSDGRCQTFDGLMGAADRVLVDYRRGLFLSRWAAYFERPSLTLIDINNMPPQWCQHQPPVSRNHQVKKSPNHRAECTLTEHVFRFGKGDSRADQGDLRHDQGLA